MTLHCYASAISVAVHSTLKVRVWKVVSKLPFSTFALCTFGGYRYCLRLNRSVATTAFWQQIVCRENHAFASHPLKIIGGCTFWYFRRYFFARCNATTYFWRQISARNKRSANANAKMSVSKRLRLIGIHKKRLSIVSRVFFIWTVFTTTPKSCWSQMPQGSLHTA